MTTAHRCSQCNAVLDAPGNECPACRGLLTRTAATRPAVERPSSGFGSSSGWLTSSDAISHGRFAPGTTLGGRYRIIGRLGQGGMGDCTAPTI